MTLLFKKEILGAVKEYKIYNLYVLCHWIPDFPCCWFSRLLEESPVFEGHRYEPHPQMKHDFFSTPTQHSNQLYYLSVCVLSEASSTPWRPPGATAAPNSRVSTWLRDTPNRSCVWTQLMTCSSPAPKVERHFTSEKKKKKKIICSLMQ